MGGGGGGSKREGKGNLSVCQHLSLQGKVVAAAAAGGAARMVYVRAWQRVTT